ncbi:sensor histidine kinase [Prevotella veroralis]|uniref:histidine kinase n=1 Tax=Prevotella veroralis F0319 TaxID=649761 RepID=C9MM05_9BACT|nr:HAMP domain-containing sensor histidine kinase [Prevotella veroralis]EEX19689.1 ATPase/histidine kinase/DNA gyrase B/HSP90 domain protein [Prevotella veroralis F0319]QUB40924.1 HAMP domain-containing histidine kinase [Prevotella veroralis]
MQWTDRIRQVKILLVLAAIFIAVASLLISHSLIRDLAQQERSKMEVWAEAMRTLSEADDNADLSLVLKVLDENNTIPVVVLGKDGTVTEYRNVEISANDASDSVKIVNKVAQQMKAAGQVIRIPLANNHNDYIEVCYDESLMLRRIAIYPYIQLGVVMLFVVVAIFALLTSKRAEQNKVWVGLSKETAHQLGTPISSLMAWLAILKETYPNDKLLPELDKDVQRLQLVADRFSKIGSVPEPVPASMNEVLYHVIDYMDRRTSKKIQMITDLPDKDVIIKMNASLFEWVIENLCKNAVDAMGGECGQIVLHLEQIDNKVVVEISDTGKGIKKKNIKNVFRPGFTTKQRGWGLGLSLAKRIVEDYHHGKIFVKCSEIGHGTTFRIELKKS